MPKKHYASPAPTTPSPRRNQTRGKQAVFSLIAKEKGPLSVADIEAGVKKEGLNQSTIYRIVNALLEEGKIREVMLSPKMRHVERAHGDDHHHVVCTVCGKIEELPGCVTEGIESKSNEKYHLFQNDRSTFIRIFWNLQNMRSLIIIRILAVVFSFGLLFPSTTSAQELRIDTVTTEKGKVMEVLSEDTRIISGLDLPQTIQTIRAQVLTGESKGTDLVIENDYLMLEKGDVFYFIKNVRAEDGAVTYFVSEPDRIPVLAGLLVLFLIAVFWVGGKQGIRGLVTLVGSLVLIMGVFLPGLLRGFPPVLASLVVSALIIVLGSYVTHGKNKTTHAAVVGMLLTIVITSLLAWVAVSAGKLSGLSSDEAVYLTVNTRGSIDMAGLLLGGILIGLLGILYDVAIGQAVAVEELGSAGAHLSPKEIYRRALRMGREHIGALVDTLAIVYVGAALPLLLLFFMNGTGSAGVLEILNREVFAEEIVRILVGSIGLIIAVPITTLIATRMLINKKPEQ